MSRSADNIRDNLRERRVDNLKVQIFDMSHGQWDVTEEMLPKMRGEIVKVVGGGVSFPWLTKIKPDHDYEWRISGGALPPGIWVFPVSKGASVRSVGSGYLLTEARDTRWRQRG